MSIVICSCIILIGRAEFLVVFFFFAMISFSLWPFYRPDKYKLGIENMKPPISLTFNLQFSIFPYFYFTERAESNEKFFSRNQEVILSASLVGFCLIVIVGVMLYLFERRVLLRQKNVSYLS